VIVNHTATQVFTKLAGRGSELIPQGLLLEFVWLHAEDHRVPAVTAGIGEGWWLVVENGGDWQVWHPPKRRRRRYLCPNLSEVGVSRPAQVDDVVEVEVLKLGYAASGTPDPS
jgi:hypothetical protein